MTHFHYQDSAEPVFAGPEIILPDKWLPNMPDLIRGPAYRPRYGLPHDPGWSVFYVIVQPEIITLDKWWLQPPLAPPRLYPVREGWFATSQEAEHPGVAAQMDWVPDAKEAPPRLALFQEGLAVYPIFETLPPPPAFHDVWQARDNFWPRKAPRLAWEGLALSDAAIYVPPVPVERWMTPPANVVRRGLPQQGWQVSTPLPIFTSQFLPPLDAIPIPGRPRLPGLVAEQLVDPLIRVDYWAADIPDVIRGRRPMPTMPVNPPLSDITPVDRWFEQPPMAPRKQRPEPGLAVLPQVLVGVDYFATAAPDLVQPLPREAGHSVAIVTQGLLEPNLGWLQQHPDPVRPDPFLAHWTRTANEAFTQTFIVGAGLVGVLRAYPRLSGKLIVNP